MIRIFKTDLIREQMSDTYITQLAVDFKRYKETGVPADHFGRDAPYNHINSLPSVRLQELQHLHLLTPPLVKKPSLRQFNKTSDTHLVYCQGFYSNEVYLLIALLSPNAHEQAHNNSIMLKMAQISEKFRNQY